MSLDIYEKDPPVTYQSKEKHRDRYFGIAISLVGFLSLIFAAWPFFIWNFDVLPTLAAKIDKAPIPQGAVLSQKTIGASDIQVAKDADGFTYFTTSYKPKGNRPKEFYISIPKLKIDRALTKVDTLSFSGNLSHFPGSALPGEVGNVFITGHSALPQFTDTSNYRTIFSHLPDLEVGDIVDVDFENQSFQYIVQYKKIVDPHDLSVLGQITGSAKNLTLMTCVPPGTSLKRMVVITSLL